MITFQECVTKLLALKKVDTDEYPDWGKYQCVDPVRYRLNKVEGIPIAGIAFGNAKEYIYNTHPSILAKFTKLPANTPIKVGDIIVYDGKTKDAAGHIAQATSSTKMLEQNGGGGSGTGTGLDAIRIVTIRPSILGILRPKEVIVKPTKAEVGNAFNWLGVADENVSAKEYAYYMARDKSVLYFKVAKALYAQKVDLKAKLAAAPTVTRDKVLEYLPAHLS